jgi:glycine oxidase
VAPSDEGFVAGASMESGRDDLDVDADIAEQLTEMAKAMWPATRTAPRIGVRVGVRGATPDGLPLAGPVAPGVSVALGPRRNGWLLAPLVASIVAAYATGDDPGPFASALDPLRFAAA